VTVAPAAVRVAAVDLGASSGRVVRVEVGPDTLSHRVVHRFGTPSSTVDGVLRWDFAALHRDVRAGLRACGPVDSVGIDSWGVDHGLLDASGALLADPVHHRDPRTTGVVAPVLELLGADRLYATTGVQVLPINTLFQLVAARQRGELAGARQLLLIPDLLAHALTGVAGTERTNASTTQLLDVRTGAWSDELISALDLPRRLFGPLREPGDPAGKLLSGNGSAPVTAVGSHDTASAVLAVPAADERFGYVSCGTWSLVGVELDAPVLSGASRRANFTNEGGVDGTVRYLRNVMGLWLLQECLREWGSPDLRGLLAEAARCTPLRTVVDPDRPEFLPPGDLPGRIRAECLRTGEPEPRNRAEYVRCVLDSLALAYRITLRTAAALSGRPITTVHLVGGGARNALLCALTAAATGLPVVAGPVEATALGNALVQARALDAVPAGRAALRALVRATQPLVRHPPGDPAPWAAAEARLLG
jgi:rhamnulokinase